MSDPVVLAVAVVVAAAAGIGIGFVARSVWASQTVRAAQDKAGRIVAEARAQQKELILQAKDEPDAPSCRRSKSACCSAMNSWTSAPTCSRNATAS